MARPKRHYPDHDFPLEPLPDFESGKGKGVRIREMTPYVDMVFRRLVKDAQLINGEALTPEPGKPVVAITSHGPGVAWMPILALVAKYYMDNGMGDLVGGMYPHWAVFLVPGLKSYYERVLGTPTRVTSVDDVVKSLKSGEINITGTAPEGANCVFSFDEYVGPFRSAGMVAAGIKADAHMVLLAHLGAEKWTRRVNLPFGISLPNTQGLNGLNIALPPLRKLDHYLGIARHYKPTLTSKDMAAMSKREARLMLSVEIERIRAELNLMTDELKERMAKLEKRSAFSTVK